MEYTKISEQYPKAYNALDKWYSEYYNRENFFNRINKYVDIFSLPFEMQVGVLERFFDERGLNVEILTWYGHTTMGFRTIIKWHTPGGHEDNYDFDVSAANDPSLGEFASRQEAQKAAFTRCFEILNSKL